MKTGRRQDPDGLRRIPRDRDAAMGRVRKRPSMLLEFQGKHYNHRQVNRGSRSYHRYDQHDSTSGIKGPKRDRYGLGLCKSAAPDSRSTSSGCARSVPPHHTTSPSLQEDSITMEINNCHEEEEEEVPLKRPRLLEDMRLSPHGSTDSVSSEPLHPMDPAAGPDSPSQPTGSPQGPGLSAYLEDIDSDEGDLLMVDEDDKAPGTPLPETTPPPPPAPLVSGSGLPTKEQLLQKMETVDRDIAATEGQIVALQKRLAELEGSIHSTPSTSSPLHPSPLPLSSSTDVEEGTEEEGVSAPPTPRDERRGSPKRSLPDSVYSENKLKARSAHAVLHHLSPLPLSSAPAVTPLYSQPWEAPGYFDIITRHCHFRSELVQLIQKQRLAKHEKEVALCKKYDSYVSDWKKRLEKAENSSKRKARDLKSRDLFERTFPELKLRREQQERLMRVDQRGYGVVRSDLELSQVMYELYEQEEAPARTRRTHALIPAMVAGGPEEKLAFHSCNGLIQDPMAMYRAAKLTNVWTDDEKKTFREKYALYPKNFEAISSFLPRKSTSDCVRYYYLSKNNEKFKQVARKATFKKRKFIKPSELGGLGPHTPPRLGMEGEKPKIRSPLLSEVMIPQTPPTTATPTTPEQNEGAKEEPLSPKPSRYGDWTEEDISSLRSGLRKWGRAWSKIYREVGGRKTATQCKQFFDDFCHDEATGLGQALSEHSSIKSEEKAQRKAESRKPTLSAAPLVRKSVGKTKPHVEPESETEKTVEGRESEAMETASNCEMASADEESGSESTITDSSPEDNSTVLAGSGHSSVRRTWKSRASSASPSHSSQAGSEKGAFDLFISAAEALNNIVPPEIALHDHNYALAPLNSVDLQGTSGLSLIAAAAAVVSPTLSRSAGSGKFPAVSPVRAPRGRPPNTQRRGSSGSTCKLSPSQLSPAGSSIYVPLTDTTKSSFRTRTRSAPSDRPRIQLSRAVPSNLRYSMSSKSNSPRPILPPASYTRTKDPSGPASNVGSGAPSLKSMIASRPQHGNGSNAAFETLVNVAVAASPAELPKTTSGPPTATLSISFQSTSNSAPATPAAAGTPLSDGTYSIDMNQAINILTLAQLAQSPASTAGMSKAPQQLLFTTPGGALGTIVSQSSHEGGVGKPPNPGTVNVLIGHLTSGSASPTPSTHSESSASTHSSTGVHSEPRPSQKPPTRTSKSPIPPPTAHPSSSSPSSSAPVTSSSEDLSNLNLLSSLVAVVAGSQAPSTLPSHTPHTLTSTQSDTVVTSSYSFAKNTPTNFSTLPLSSTNTTLRSSAFKATNLPPALLAQSPSSDKPQDRKELSTRTKMHEKAPPLSSLVNSEHLRSSRSPVANSSPLDHLPRSVVRSSSLTHPQSSHSTTNSSSSSPHPLPTYPPPAPSISQQSTLLLYTRSLSLPNASGAEVISEEEDHLESATRGISELSKLLGTDSGSDSLGGASDNMASSYRNSWGDQGASGIPPPVRTSRSHRGVSPVFSAKSELGTDSSKYLSGLLESHTSHSTPSQKNTSTNDVSMSSLR